MIEKLFKRYKHNLQPKRDNVVDRPYLFENQCSSTFTDLARRSQRWAHQPSYYTSSPVRTAMGDRSRVISHPSHLSGTKNEDQPKFGDALRLQSKFRHGIGNSFLDARVGGR